MSKSEPMTHADFAVLVAFADLILEHVREDREVEHHIVKHGQPFRCEDGEHVAIEAQCTCGRPLTAIFTAAESDALDLLGEAT
jgi:hypothetical protein